MKLWNNTTKRVAKKKINKMRSRWRKLNLAKTLRSGDIVSTCKGYNERIKEISPEYSRFGLSKGEFVVDFDIITESGGSCSLVHCCTVPAKTKQEVIDYWLQFTTDEGKKWLAEMKNIGFINFPDDITEALLEGKEVFDEDGQPLYEFCTEYERENRF